MPTLNAILKTARERALAANLPYAGALTPTEAYYLSQHAPSARIVDVRSHAEQDRHDSQGLRCDAECGEQDQRQRCDREGA
ncbi:MAG: hypothetical protein ABL868_02310, partial [Sulfuriferula sp.]